MDPRGDKKKQKRERHFPSHSSDSDKSSPSIELRPFWPEDSHRVRGLIESVLAEFGFGLGGHNEDWDVERMAEFYASPESVFLVLEAEGEIVGTVGIKHRSAAEAELRRMYLRPDLRGGGHGVRMLRASLEFALSRGYEKLFLETSGKFEKAIALYKSYGFALTDRHAEHCHLVYEKSLITPE